jgi:CheY-like chemotaxis protein
MKKVLVVDDSKTILKTAKLILKDIYEVYLATSGEMALEIILKKQIDIILMDVDMPGMNGIETVKEIKKNNEWVNIPIVFFTALASKEVVAQCMSVGMDGYIIKPYMPEDLIEKIKAVLHE